MRSLASIALLVTCFSGPVLAAEPVPRVSPGIPVYSVSPGASGSVSSSARSQRYEVIDGRTVPEGGYSSQYGSRSGSFSVQQRGGIRQSIEYPGGQRIELQSGQGSSQVEQQR